MKIASLFLSASAVGVFGFVGCSSSSSTPAVTTDAGTSDTGATGGDAVQTGKLQEFPNPIPVDGAKVDFITTTNGTLTTTTAADGAYSLPIPKTVKGMLTISKDKFLTLREQEWYLIGNTDRGDTNFLSFATRDLLQDTLKAATGGAAIDPAKGLFGIHIEKGGACASTEGATVTISPAATKAVYFTGSLPNAALTSINADAFPSVAFYNVPVNTDITITVTHPKCKQAAFPYTQGNLVYTGKVQALPGDVLTFARAFLE